MSFSSTQYWPPMHGQTLDEVPQDAHNAFPSHQNASPLNNYGWIPPYPVASWSPQTSAMQQSSHARSTDGQSLNNDSPSTGETSSAPGTASEATGSEHSASISQFPTSHPNNYSTAGPPSSASFRANRRQTSAYAGSQAALQGRPASSSEPPPVMRPRQPSDGASAQSARARYDYENQLLVYLRDEQLMPWKEITKQFEMAFNRRYQMPALQMRYGRLKQRTNPWTDQDTAALQLAHEYYAEKRYEIIASKMLEFGATEAWPAKKCQQKWRQLFESSPRAESSPHDPQMQQNIHTFHASESPAESS